MFNDAKEIVMFSFILAAVLSQSPAVAPAPAATPSVEVSTPVSAVTLIPADAPAAPALETDALKDGKKVVKYEGREGCVEQTGSRIKRRDKATCSNGRSISKEDLERSGGSLVPYNAPAIPAGAGN
jgi:hypothetical protein